MNHTHQDERLIKRCIELAEQSLRNGDSPFGSIIARNGNIIAESANAIIVERDVTRHAEILAMRTAQKILASSDLTDCEIYSNCEPCPMCAFMMRELKFKRVVFAAHSPFMGGYSKWNILQDGELQIFAPVFAVPPEVVSGVLEEEAKQTFFRAGWSKGFFTRAESSTS